MGYTEHINWNYKYQTLKTLERYACNMEKVPYHSAVPDEEIVKEPLPDVEESLSTTGLVIDGIKRYVVNSCNGIESKMDESFRQLLLNMYHVVDNIIAESLAETLDIQSYFESISEFTEVWTSVFNAMQKSDPPAVADTTSDCKELVIDTSALVIGMTVKNYKFLCEMLQQPVKAGKSRTLQLKDFKRYFDWEKTGQKFIITDVYDTPLPKDDRRKLGNNSIYVQCVEVVLLEYLSKQDGHASTLTKRNWWKMLGIVNRKYGTMPEEQLEDLDESVNPWEIRHFYQRCNSRLTQILFSALNSLQSRRVIEYETQTMIVAKNEYGKSVYFVATDAQKKKILDVEHYVLNVVYKYEKMVQVFLRFQEKEFYEKVNEILFEKYGWDHCFKQIKIIYISGVKQVYDELKVNLQKELLNQRVMTAVENSMKKQYERWIRDQELYKNQLKFYDDMVLRNLIEGVENEFSEPERPFNPPSTYVEAHTLLMDELIKIGHKDMKFSPEEFLASNEETNTLYDFER